MHNFYLVDAGEVPHLGAILDRRASCLDVLPQESLPAGRGHLLLLQLDSELVEFHRGIGMVVFPVDLPSVRASDAVIIERDLETLCG